MSRPVKWGLRVLVFLAILLSGPVFMVACSNMDTSANWRDADRSSAGLAPLVTESPQALVQVYGARAFSWRGYFAIHTWIATKPEGADSYTVHEVTGWGSNKVRSYRALPDRAWYGAPPALLASISGETAARLIPDIEQAVADYPYPHTYEAWPGPNSNTFVAWIIRQVPGLEVNLPNTAIGKDYLGNGYVAETPSGAGYQLSAGGYIGILAGVREGLELNVLGLSLGVDPRHLAIKLPGVGSLGLLDPWPQTLP
ncbi:DUF3750 domain-containing protein [Marinobacter sp. M1N3S26]|uniref:DUF3750 domain-containing protein n=1 Tax=Marinobacter sp. M1N3S26 TaxID=3382299 RepID=UPI00387AFAAD